MTAAPATVTRPPASALMTGEVSEPSAPAAMRAAGLVRTTTTGADARTKKVTLTAKARRIIGKLGAEWRATTAAVADIESELPYPVGQVVTDIEAALARQSFHDRIAEKLASDPDWKQKTG
jgi:DNA-binding MarR family transcriptional regulator